MELTALKPDRTLINHDFSHYLLSSKKVEVRRIGINEAKSYFLTSEQYSYQHGKLFSNIRQLVRDDFIDEEDHLYFVDNNNNINRVVYKANVSVFYYKFICLEMSRYYAKKNFLKNFIISKFFFKTNMQILIFLFLDCQLYQKTAAFHN